MARRGVAAAALWLVGVLSGSGAVVAAPAPNVPLFAGPATLRLDGDAGPRRWPELRFGTHAVIALLVAEGGGEPCRATVTLVPRGSSAASEAALGLGFDVPARRQVIDAVVLPIEYATARLGVDVTCPRWWLELRPLPDPDLEVSVTFDRYMVRGRTIDRLASQTRRVQGRYAAYTTWHTRWQLVGEERAGSCTARSGGIRLDAEVDLPRWQPAAGADRSAVRRWRRFTDDLATHELGHVTIALQGAHAIGELLERGFTAPTCAEAHARADRAAGRLHDRWERVNAGYDRRTRHGLRQGTALR